MYIIEHCVKAINANDMTGSEEPVVPMGGAKARGLQPGSQDWATKPPWGPRARTACVAGFGQCL